MAKIVHATKYYHPRSGGIETYTKDLAEGCAEKGFEVEVVCSSNDSKESREEINGVTVRRLPKIFDVFHAPFNTGFLKAISESKADILHIHLPNPWLEANMPFLRFEGKVVATYHADAPHYTPLHTILDVVRSPFLNATLKMCDSIIVSSPNYAEGSPYLKKYADKLKVVPHGTREHKGRTEKTILRNLGITSGEKTILFVGRLYPYKGLDYLIDALKILDDRGENFKAVIAGSGYLREGLERKSEKLGIKEKVVFAGEVGEKEKYSLYDACDVFVLPSINRGEAFGISLIEAMSRGMPLVTTRIPHSGVSFVNAEGETGISAEPCDALSLADALGKMLSNECMREKMGRNARRRFRENFTIDKMVDGTIEAYGIRPPPQAMRPKV